MSKIVLKGVPEASYDDGMRALILEVSSHPSPRLFVSILSWEDIGEESDPDCEKWHPELRALRDKKLQMTIRGNRMKHLTAGILFILTLVPTLAVAEERFSGLGGSCVAQNIETKEVRPCTKVEREKYKAIFNCSESMKQAIKDMEPYTQKNMVLTEDNGKGIYRWTGNALMPPDVLERWEETKKECGIR